MLLDRKLVFLSIGIADILLSYVVFTSQQYFSFIAMLCLIGIIGSGILLLLMPYYCEFDADKNSRSPIFLIALSAISVILIIYEAYFDLISPNISSYNAFDLFLIFTAICIFIFGAYLIKRLSSETSRHYLPIIASVIILSALIFSIQLYRISNSRWSGSDEVLFNFYAYSIFLHGNNPYQSTMSPVLKSYNTDPTLLLNGSCECSYDYPALSFLLPGTIGLVIGNYIYAVIFLTLLLAVAVAFLLYRSGKGPFALLPIAVWFSAFLYTVQAPLGQLVAVSLFLLMAYIYRSKPILSSVFLGLAASTHQISWIALPFFLVMMLRHSGKAAVFKSILAVLGLFLIANGYFIALSPSAAISNMLNLFFTRLQFNGPSIMQLFVAFYPTTYWYASFAIMSTVAVSLVLFYLYTNTLRPLVAIVPIAIFFLSWRNLFSYSFVFIPLLIAIYYSENEDKITDLLKNKRPIIYGLAFLLLLCTAVLLYSHGIYSRSNLLKITNLAIVAQKNATFGQITSPIIVNVSNNADKPETIFFYVVSRSPSSIQWFYGSPAETIPAHGYHEYTLPYRLPKTSNVTKFYIFVLSNDYILTVARNSP